MMSSIRLAASPLSGIDVSQRKTASSIADRAYVLPLYSVPTYYIAANDVVFPTHADTSVP